MSAPKARGRRGSAVRAGSAVHDGLVGARQLVGTPYLADPVLRGEYARDIAPRTEAALGRLLDVVYGAPTAVAAVPPARALDLGAGTGAVGRTLRARFGEAFEVIAVDRVASLGAVRANLAIELPAVPGTFDLIVAAHLLNELYVERAPAERVALRARRVLAWARALLAPQGHLILIEPALRETSRELLALRDQLITSGLHVVAPCFWTGPCPALARERDWCHDAAPVRSQPRVDFSYLVLGAEPVARATDLFRIVSDPLREKGRLRLFGCGASGRHPLVRLDRHRSAANASFSDLVRGDAAEVAPTHLEADGLRLTAETVVTPSSSASP